MDMTTMGWILAGAACVVIGFTKTGISGIGVLGVVLMATAVPALKSPGLLLPLLIVGDCFAIALYRRHASWPHLLRLFPTVAVGLAAGLTMFMMLESNQVFGRVLGGLALVMIAFYAIKKLGRSDWLERAPKTKWFAALTGVLAGFATGLGNAAGAMTSIYMFSMRLDKRQFLGTAAWFFLIVNVVKVPFYVWQGRIGLDTLKVDVCVVPLIVVGALIGPRVLKVVPQRLFEILVMVLVTVGAAKLLIGT